MTTPHEKTGFFQRQSFSEKSAWVMFPALLIASLFYVAPIFGALRAGDPLPPPGMNVIVFILILIALAIVGHVIAALVDVSSAYEAADERDRNVILHAEAWSSTVFGFVALLGLVSYFVLRSGDILFHVVFSGLILSHLISSGLTLIAYRRSI